MHDIVLQTELESAAQLAFIAFQQAMIADMHGNLVLFFATERPGVMTDLGQQLVHVREGVVDRLLPGFNT